MKRTEYGRGMREDTGGKQLRREEKLREGKVRTVEGKGRGTWIRKMWLTNGIMKGRGKGYGSERRREGE